MNVGPSSDRPVVLVAHLRRYIHAATALHQAGMLRRFVSAPVAAEPLPVLEWLGPRALVDRFDATRVQASLRGVPMRRMWVAQATAFAAQQVALATHRGTALPLRSAIWDLAGSAHLGRPRIVHGVSGVSALLGRLAHRRGALVVCDARAAHPRVASQRVERASAGEGPRRRAPDAGIMNRMVAEYAAADVIICNSAYTRQTFLDEGFAADRVLAVPLGCDLTGFSPAPRPPARFTVLFAGREPLGKGLLDLAEACRSLTADASVIVAGSTDARTRQVLAGLPIEVELLGDVAPHEMPALYRRASVLALPSFSDGFGMVVLEAMASGVTPIVSTNVGAAELLSDGLDGYVVAPADPDALADRLVALATDPDRLGRMGMAARATAEANTWQRYGERLVEAYRQVILPLAGCG